MYQQKNPPTREDVLNLISSGQWPPEPLGCLLTANIWQRKIRIFDIFWVPSSNCKLISSVYGESSDQALTVMTYAVKKNGSCTYAILEGYYGTIEPLSRPYDEAQNMLKALYEAPELNDADNESSSDGSSTY